MTDTADAMRQFRNVMGRFATGVTVVTTEVDGAVHGMTANAFSSLSLKPLLLLVCIDNNGSSAEWFDGCQHFAINILARDQEAVSNHFASSKRHDNPMGAFAYSTASTGAPVLDDTIAYADCVVHERLAGGDHTILIGRVVDAKIGREDVEPLLFWGGQYRVLEGNPGPMAPDLLRAWDD